VAAVRESSARLLSYADAAAYLGLSYWTIRAWVESGKPPAIRFGERLLRVERSALDQYVDACRVA
jgi:excisionase family DNA binding protein